MSHLFPIAQIGTGTLSSGTATIDSSAVQAGSIIIVTGQSGTVNLGALQITTRTAGTSFTVRSTNLLDSRSFGYLIMNP